MKVKDNKAKMKRAIADSKADDYHFFDKDTMRFWGSAVVTGMFPNDTFVTIEDNYNRTKKLYTVRQYNWETHRVATVSKFQEFERLDDAIEFAVNYM